MLRIHFTSRDLQSIRVARQPHALWELVCGVCRLDSRQGALEFGHWRRSVRDRLAEDPRAGRALSPLRTLIPPVGYIPDFLTPSVTGSGLAGGLDEVRATSRARLSRELSRLAESRPLPSWVSTLDRPGTKALGALTRALEVSCGTLLEPYWPRVQAAVGDDVELRARALLDGGTSALLNSLRPHARWHPPVLEVDYPVNRELHLEGRGLLLVPSYFCWRRPTALADPTLGPVLVYPVAKQPLEIVRESGDGLERLLGRTRTVVLAHLARHGSRTTSEVAAAANIALPSASYQLGVLRDGGLIASHRDGQFVRHSATPLGLRLLDR
ncbi:DNA-binding transcriptional regulator, ArsR family [Streptomyces sp. 3213]|uniref:ArsR/SmtB family transcription factor n=1 Tax=Streptomyces sp. 3213.3 TaxID=1855348 RepID=UPI0008947C5B|nr:helix-turn-helix domain-containing protein [Streptomyces sp. 3213.3]SEC47373.1 DNA-binding transcriptional regulator, ArsR family [Streptomyces sp. 3213] [Streptomyces sp. 3213.3]